MVAETYRLPACAVERLWSVLPELVMRWSEPANDATPPRSWLEAYPSDNLRNIDHLKGILLCHTLSPTWDSAALLAELGRCLRVACGLALPLRLMLAGSTWAAYNWVVMDLKAEANLAINARWRRGLYSLLDAAVDPLRVEVDNCETTTLPDKRAFNDVEILASEYVQLARALWGPAVDTRRYTPDEVNDMLASLELRSQRQPELDLLKLPLLNRALLPATSVLRTVLSNLRRLDRSTFLYFFLQYFHQARYDSCLKLAVRRERDFDEPFRTLSLAIGKEPAYDSQASLYFSDYYFDRETAAEPPHLTVHPYYFPSGLLYARYPDPSDARTHCLMLDDQEQSKIERSLHAIAPLDRGRFLADLLSFAHWFGRRDKQLHRAVASWFKSCGCEGGEQSWRLYAVDQAAFAERTAEWGVLLFSELVANEHPPYYFLPYVWADLGVTPDKEAGLVALILAAVRRVLPLPDLLRTP
ncbi:MAG: hypothetical protein JW952_06595 [Candidatus Eisenbacteria bacterium]|nr:hypothetical protein [Candidatus Eisenbacteria bacterium]